MLGTKHLVVAIDFLSMEKNSIEFNVIISLFVLKQVCVCFETNDLHVSKLHKAVFVH